MIKLSLHLLDYIIIISFLVVTLYVGFRFARRQNSLKSFFLAQGRVPAWAIGMSLLATLISSVTFLAYPGEGFTSNWILLVQGLMVPVVLLGTIWFIVPLYRKVIGLSTYEYFEKRFGVFARYYSSLAFVLRQFSSMGTVLFLLALALDNMIGGNTMIMIVIIGLIIIAVNLMGGIEAVIWLDVFQGFMLFATGIICLTVILFSADGGPAAVWQIAKANGRTGFGPYDADLTKLTFLVMAINGVFYAIQKYGTDQTVVQRYLTAKTDKGAIRASLMGILLTVPVWMLFMFIGTALFAYYQQHSLPAGLRAEQIFPYFIATRLPVGVTGLILSAMISAAIAARRDRRSRLPLLRAQRAVGPRRRVRPAHEGTARSRSGASRAHHPRIADPTRFGQRIVGVRRGAPHHSDAVAEQRVHRRGSRRFRSQGARAAEG
jgi:SSS family solute:Na+ symporter